ncbi:MAG: NAD-dependent epimerase/dehydratase family protein, partial [Xanthomonadales bacterium]|nr:NAD-dependent epimerase/dehydratase family protein [Xanthomonadales bacterium]
MNILVTGAAGFIGFHLASRLLRDGHRVTGLDNLNAYYDPELKRARLEQ